MQGNMHGFNGFMSGGGLWTILGILLAVFLVVAIVRMMRKQS